MALAFRKAQGPVAIEWHDHTDLKDPLERMIAAAQLHLVLETPLPGASANELSKEPSHCDHLSKKSVD